jgi:methanogenic corrinoid protein MtbC1
MMSEELVNLMADMKEAETLNLVKRMISESADPLSIMDDARKAMGIVGQRFEKEEYFISDLIMAGEILKGISELVKPLLVKKEGRAKRGRARIGTVEGDIHDIGKNIVTFMLDVGGSKVLDLGIDVPVVVFVEKIMEFKPRVVGLSGFLTLAFDSVKNTVEALESAGLRDSIKIMIGGGQIDEEVCRYVKADAYGRDAVAAVNLCKDWMGL